MDVEESPVASGQAQRCGEDLGGSAAATQDGRPEQRNEEDVVSIEEAVPEGAQGTTAFFLFSNVHRSRVKSHLQASVQEGQKVTIGAVGKAIGALWGRCSEATKAAYTEAAKLVRRPCSFELCLFHSSLRGPSHMRCAEQGQSASRRS